MYNIVARGFSLVGCRHWGGNWWRSGPQISPQRAWRKEREILFIWSEYWNPRYLWESTKIGSKDEKICLFVSHDLRKTIFFSIWDSITISSVFFALASRKNLLSSHPFFPRSSKKPGFFWSLDVHAKKTSRFFQRNMSPHLWALLFLKKRGVQIEKNFFDRWQYK